MKENVWLINGEMGMLREHDVRFDDGILLVKSLPHTNTGFFRSEWVVICVLTAGSAACTIDSQEHALHARDMLVILPGTVVDKGKASADVRMDCLCISKRMLEASVPFSMFNWDLMSFLSTHPVFSLQEGDYRRFSLFYALLSDKLGHQEELCYRESMQCLLKSFLYDFSNVVGRHIPLTKGGRYSQGKNLFKGFLNELSSVHPRPRSVSYYAEKLNVTPKYLSAVCKNASGNTASELIHKAVTKDISDLLLYSNKSIKEIMVELDFPSLSFFGKYVKKHFGMGPKEFRAKMSS